MSKAFRNSFSDLLVYYFQLLLFMQLAATNQHLNSCWNRLDLHSFSHSLSILHASNPTIWHIHFSSYRTTQVQHSATEYLKAHTQKVLNTS